MTHQLAGYERAASQAAAAGAALTTAAAALVDGRCAKVPPRPGIPGKIYYQE